MNDADLAAATVGTIEQRDVQAREVANGYVLAGNRRFMEPDTGTARLGLTFEGVAVDRPSAAQAIANFFDHGSFDSLPTPPAS